MLKVHKFTLLEILATMTIILIIAGLIMAASSTAARMAKKSRCQAQINAVEIALEQYKSEWGFYPESMDTTTKIATTSWWDSIGSLPYNVYTLDTNGDGLVNSEDDPTYQSQKPLIDNTTIGMKSDPTYKYIDPYGSPFYYEPDPANGVNKMKFDLWSQGPDGEHGVAGVDDDGLNGVDDAGDAQTVDAEESDDVTNWGRN